VEGVEWVLVVGGACVIVVVDHDLFSRFSSLVVVVVVVLLLLLLLLLSQAQWVPSFAPWTVKTDGLVFNKHANRWERPIFPSSKPSDRGEAVYVPVAV